MRYPLGFVRKAKEVRDPRPKANLFTRKNTASMMHGVSLWYPRSLSHTTSGIYLAEARGKKPDDLDNKGQRWEESLCPDLARACTGVADAFGGKRTVGYLFETNRATRYSPRRVQQIIKETADQAGIAKRVYPHLLTALGGYHTARAGNAY